MNGGGVKLAQSSLPPSIADVLSSGPLSMERTRNVLLDLLYSYGCLRRLLLIHVFILAKGTTFYYREHSCGIS